MKTRKTPMRVCAGCQEQKSKKEMIRVVRTPEGAVEIDKTGKKSGRGVYLCPNSECLKKAIRAKALERAFSTQIPPEVLDALVQTMEEQANE